MVVPASSVEPNTTMKNSYPTPPSAVAAADSVYSITPVVDNSSTAATTTDLYHDKTRAQQDATHKILQQQQTIHSSLGSIPTTSVRTNWIQSIFDCLYVESSIQLREWRHNRCLMTPLSSILLLLGLIGWFLLTLYQFPIMILIFCFSPFLVRIQLYIIEFLYPLSLGRYIHLGLLRVIRRQQSNQMYHYQPRIHKSGGGGVAAINPSNIENTAQLSHTGKSNIPLATTTTITSSTTIPTLITHSRSLETRIVIVPNRVYLHVLPQLLDNLGYLIVCLPNPDTNNKNPDTNNNNDTTSTIVDGSSPATETTGLVEMNHTMMKMNPTSPNHKNHHHDTTSSSGDRIVGLIVDCGDAKDVIQQIQWIRTYHYQQQFIEIQMILSTHRHHDHTAGNYGIQQDPILGPVIQHVVGGTVEHVPGCNYPVTNGEYIVLPQHGNNNMNDVIEIECVATPAHTRGSITYILRPLSTTTTTTSTSSSHDDTHPAAAYIFTGDTMFSGGGGVPFEADIDPGQEGNALRMNAHSFIKASAAGHAVERCFAEIMFRSVPILNQMIQETGDRILLFPGHEYTNELLGRQLNQPTENCRWKNFPPSVFFETLSQFYVSNHRRSLPQSSGKLFMALTTLSRERRTNPYLRSLKKRGEIVLSAIRVWHRYFAQTKVLDSMQHEGSYGLSGGDCLNDDRDTSNSNRKSTASQWTLDVHDVSASVFTTVYTTDLNAIIHDLQSGQLDAPRAARRLKEMQSVTDEPVIGRRPIPGTLPSDRTIYKGLVGWALLGSSPTALTRSDSVAMKLPTPVTRSSDEIQVSKSRLIAVLYWLGLLDEANEGQSMVLMIEQLWKEAYSFKVFRGMQQHITPMDYSNVYEHEEEGGSKSGSDDLVDLGVLKWIVYGVPRHPPSWMARFCMLCQGSEPSPPISSSLAVISNEAVVSTQEAPSYHYAIHPIHNCGLPIQSGELVRHDIFTCPLCRSATGSPQVDRPEELSSHLDRPTWHTFGTNSVVAVPATTKKRTTRETRPHLTINTTTSVLQDGNEEDGSYIEVTPEHLGLLLR